MIHLVYIISMIIMFHHLYIGDMSAFRQCFCMLIGLMILEKLADVKEELKKQTASKEKVAP